MNQKHAVVTGAYGFLGRNVAKVFAANGYMVTGLGHGTWLRSEWQQWGLSDWHSCDISVQTLQTYIQTPDIIIHCAGSGSVGYSLTHPMQDYERTTFTTLSILEYIRLYSPKTVFLYPSSAAVYGKTEHMPIIETSVLKPISPYGVHKKIGEELCQSYASHFCVSVAIVRFFSLYGIPLRKQLLWDVCCKVVQNDMQFYGTGKEIRDWLHVTDAAKLLYQISNSTSPKAPVFNGGSGLGVTVSEIIESVLRQMNVRVSPTFSHSAKSGDPYGYIADMGKSFQLGWKPEVLLDDGIKDYTSWFLSGGL